MMKKLISILVIALILTGCAGSKKKTSSSKSNDTASNESLGNTFYKMVNLGTASNRKNFYNSVNSVEDFEKIGRQLQVLSTSYYSTNDYYMAEGTQLTTANYKQLEGRSDNPNEYPYSLQPKKGTTIEGVTNAIMVSTIYEQDYYTKSGNNYTLKGMSFAIVISPRDENNKELTTKMSESVISDYAKSIIKPMYNFLQTLKKTKNIPVNICVYQAYDAVDSDSQVDGKFIYQCYCENSLGTIKKLTYNTVIFTSTEATKIDSETAEQFAEFKTKMKNEAEEAIGIIGYGFYKDKTIQSMKIQMTVNIKTYTELLYLTSTAADDLANRFKDFDTTVVIYSQDKLEGFITISNGQAKTTMV